MAREKRTGLRVINLVQKQPGITYKEMMKKLRISRASLSQAIMRLREKGLIDVRTGEKRHPQILTVYYCGEEEQKTKQVKCLSCQSTFASEGPHIRICDRCKNASFWNNPGFCGSYEVRM